MGRRMKGEGGVTQRADGRWMGTIEVGWGPDGKRRRRYVYGRTQREAVTKLAAERRKVTEHGAGLTSTMTVEKYLTQWLETVAAPRVKPKTLTSYRSVVTVHLIPRLGKHRLDLLAPQHVRTMDRDVAKVRSSSTALKVHAVLSKALTDAVREGLVIRNVAEAVDRPRRAVNTRGSLTIEEAQRLYAHARTLPGAQGDRWLLALLTGMRQGECLGLTRESIDLEQGMLVVQWQLQRLPYAHGCTAPCGRRFAGDCPERRTDLPAGFEAEHLAGGLYLVRPKSRQGWRTFPLVGPLQDAIMRQINRPGPRLLFTDAGAPIDPRADSAAWHEMLDAAGVRPVPLHSARHTAMTLFKKSGSDEHTTMTIAGHAQALTTRGYTHIDPEMQRKALASMYELLSPR